ncbi:MAG: hypothetical protein E4H14_03515 [Candidatus Thorarchaeota archaeon]|nr:MAG: hypothetical protein E4H14_03515 [Candidatus Thorarchaeota archaeon]
MKNIKSLHVRELFTKWWTERWVRAIVLLLIPIGVIDTIYTLVISQVYGVQAEFNPITRTLLEAGFWFPWSILNIGGFMLFCMMTGSYYLHSRTNPSGPDTFWFSFVIALRVAMAGYNVTFLYMPFVITIYPPFWVALFSFGFTLYSMNKLLKRQHDLSWAQTRYSLSSRMQSYKDAKLIESAGIPQDEEPDSTRWDEDVKREIKEDRSKEPRQLWQHAWVKRVVYLTGSALSFVLMGATIQFISDFSGLTQWSQQQGPYFVLNEFTGPPVMASFISIIFFMGLSLFLIMKAFSTTQEFDI